VRLYSSRLGLQGILDMLVITDDEGVVVEFKNTTQPPARNHTY